MAKSREIKVGILVAVAGIILYFGFNYLKGKDFFSDQQTYYVIYKDVNGLQPSNPVILNGLNVGQVMSIKTNPDDKYKMRVHIEIDEDIKLGDSTVAIISSSLLGDMGINLKLGYKSGGVNYFEDEDTLFAGQEKDLMEVIEEKLHPIIVNVENLTGKADSLFDKDSEKNLKNIIANTDTTLVQLKDFMKSLQPSMKSITGQFSSLTGSLKSTLEKEVSPLMQKFGVLADSLGDADLKRTVAEMNELLSNMNSLTSKLDTNTGTLGMLINDSTLYVNLNATLDSLGVLIDNMNEKKGHMVVNVMGDPYKKEARWQKKKAKREEKEAKKNK